MKTTHLQVAAGELRSLAGRILKEARQDTERRLIASKAGISVLQYGILSILKDKNFTLSELSGRMGREPATLLPAVDTLENNGMLLRGQDPKDRRRTPLTITGQGMALLQRVPQVGENDLLLQALKRLGDQKVDQLISLLRQVSPEAAPDKNQIDLQDHSRIRKTRPAELIVQANPRR